MKFSIMFCTIVIIFICLCLNNVVMSDDDSDYDDYTDNINRRGKGAMCPSLTLANGRVRLRSRGRIAKFLCRVGYQALGRRFATCIRGHWNAQPPICISRGCPTVVPPTNGRLMLDYRGALLNFVCYPGFILIGSKRLYCDGRKWNASVPTCEVANKHPLLDCNFERENICGWSQDTSHDFDWTRHNFVTPSGHVGTGPSHDHTLGEGRDGHYMYIESSSPRVENDTARLYSPVYTMPVPSQYGACFRFWYHMYGATSGFLRVFIKPTSKDLFTLVPAFTIYGDQGNVWRPGFVDVPQQLEPFQIVIEGIRGPGYVSDTAIDDVHLTFVGNCDEFRVTVSNASSTTITNFDDFRMSSSVLPLSTSHDKELKEMTSSENQADAVSQTVSTPTVSSGSLTNSTPFSSISSMSSPVVSSWQPLLTTLRPFTMSISTTTPMPQTSSALQSTTVPLLTTVKVSSIAVTAAPTTVSQFTSTFTTTPMIKIVSTTMPTKSFNVTSTYNQPTLVTRITTSKTNSTIMVPQSTSKVPLIPTEKWRIPSTAATTSVSTARSTLTNYKPMSQTPTTKFTTSTQSTITSAAKPVTKFSTPTITTSSKTTKRITRPIFITTFIPSTKLSTTTRNSNTFTKSSTQPTLTVTRLTSAAAAASTFFDKKVSSSTKRYPNVSPKIETTVIDPSTSTLQASDFEFTDINVAADRVITSTEQNNEINLFPQDMETSYDDSNDRASTGPLPPWTYLKRSSSNDQISGGRLRMPCNVAAAQAVNDADKQSSSAPTLIGITIGIVVGVAIVGIIVTKTYRRIRSGQEALTDDSEVRYLKDGEVRVEFSDLNLRYAGPDDDSGYFWATFGSK